jgi:hypothetical protein
MSNKRKLLGPGPDPQRRLSAALGQRAADLNACAGRFGRIIELVARHDAGQARTVGELVDGMPDSADRRELLALLKAVLPADTGPEGTEPDGQHHD